MAISDEEAKLSKERTAMIVQSEETFPPLVEQAPDAIIVFDPNTNCIVEANPGLESRSDTRGMNCRGTICGNSTHRLSDQPAVLTMGALNDHTREHPLRVSILEDEPMDVRVRWAIHQRQKTGKG
jgi:hypothetical protein